MSQRRQGAAVSIKQLSSGWWHIRSGNQWTQPPIWPCDEAALREHACQEPSDSFIREAMAIAATLDGKVRP